VVDVADVRVDYKKLDSLSRRYGLTSNGLSVRRASDANVMEVMEGVYASVENLNSGLLKRLNLELYQYYDETEYIKSAITKVQQNIFIGGSLTVLVLMLFLHLGRATLLAVPLIVGCSLASVFVSPWFFLATAVLMLAAGLWFGRGALVVGLAIPVSIVGTFLVLGLLGRSLNVISLAGLAFAVGMLVDNAVVVLENIFRLRESGMKAWEAATRGTASVAGAVVASTLTTIAVFIPVLFVQETSGQLFKDIALAIAAAVGLSLVVSFTLIPTAAARLFAGVNFKSTNEEQDSSVGLVRLIGGVGAGFSNWLSRATGWILQTRYRSAALIASMVLFSVGVSYWLWPKVEYLPTGNRNFVFCSLSPPPGHNIEHLMDMGLTLEEETKPYWNVDADAVDSLNLEYPAIRYYFYAVRGTSVFMGMSAMDESRVRELVPLMRKVSGQFPGTRALAKQSSLFERGLTSGRTIDIEIRGGDLEKLIEVGRRVMADVAQVLPYAQASPQPSLDLASPEIHIQPKLIESSEIGFSAADLGYMVDAYVDGAYAGDYFVDGEKIDLTIKGQDAFATRTQDIEYLPVSTPNGQIVPLNTLAEVEYASGPESILRRERMRAINISVTPPITMPLEEAMQRIDQGIVSKLQADGVIDGETMIRLSGTADKLRQAWNALRWNLILALAITYLLMAALFESWLYPFVIIFTVPLGAVGGVLGLSLLNLFVFQALDVITMLGFIILIGTVVNNPILIVHQSLNFMREGDVPREAITKSVKTRIRPIFITTTTTVLGLLPLVLFPGAGSELYRGLGVVVLGGLVLSTAFTLFLVPAVFVLTIDLKQAIIARLQKS
ncbi:MAG: efflux RND transporter permease subunit, partial [Planctomycetota bacterium]